MAKARAISKRRKAVQNIRKITRTMQFIATARFQVRVQTGHRHHPYTEHITAAGRATLRHQAQIEHPLLRSTHERTRRP